MLNDNECFVESLLSGFIAFHCVIPIFFLFFHLGLLHVIYDNIIMSCFQYSVFRLFVVSWPNIRLIFSTVRCYFDGVQVGRMGCVPACGGDSCFVLATQPAPPGSALGYGRYVTGRSIKKCFDIYLPVTKALKRSTNSS